ncbi:diguanylate cyclase (GGDEF) domain protein [compost metagenome]
MGRWAGSVIAEDESLAELKLLASTDFLTGVKNRGHFIAEAEREIRRARRCVSPLSLILIDLDHFKRINDTYMGAALSLKTGSISKRWPWICT